MSASLHPAPHGTAARDTGTIRPVARAALATTLAAALAAVAIDTASAEATADTPPAPAARELRVCADPSNLPYSNEREEGFENRIARVVADDLGMSLRFVWSQQRRAFLRRTLNAGECDVVVGWPSGQRGLAQTEPYYRSSYVFVTAAHRKLRLRDFDDPQLRGLKIGLQAVGAEGASTPPASALAKRGIVGNIVGFPMWGDDGRDDGQQRIVDAVAEGAVDVAIVWGPIAGYFARRHGEALTLTAVTPDATQPALAFEYAMRMVVRGTEPALRVELQAAMTRRAPQIQAILRDYGVPLGGRDEPDPAQAARDAAALHAAAASTGRIQNQQGN